MDDLVELTFRDGTRWVPKYLADMMVDLETFRYSYDEAIQLGNRLAVQGFVDRKLDNVIESHFKRMR